MKINQQKWEDLARRKIGDELVAGLFIRGVNEEIGLYRIVKEQVKELDYKGALQQFTKLEEQLTGAMKAFEEIDEGNRRLFSGWFSTIVNMSKRPEAASVDSKNVIGKLEDLESTIAAWSQALQIICERLANGGQFRRKGYVSTFPQHHLAYRIRLLYKELLNLPNLPAQDDVDFDPILETLLKHLGCDSNMSRVYRKSNPITS